MLSENAAGGNAPVWADLTNFDDRYNALLQIVWRADNKVRTNWLWSRDGQENGNATAG